MEANTRSEKRKAMKMRLKTNTPLIPKRASGLIPTCLNTAISRCIYSHIPREDIKALLGNLIEYFTDEESAKAVRESIDAEFDSQDNISLGDRQKLTRKYITWDYRSVGHSE